mmetsp:Transcript_2909/g.5283  ORF Transcript_2909/g.5283 Transcript_2909/m.5283 type:complete len:642 (-) Transcript_2909:157-2082(-)
MTELAQEHLTFDSEHRLRSENLPFDIDVWYPRVKQFTFQTEFLPLLKTECAAIQAFYNVSYRNTRPHLTRSEIASLKNLEAEIDQLLLKHFSPAEQGAFVRLCGRSPKDGEPLDPTKVYESYLRHLADVHAEVQEQQHADQQGAVSLQSKMAAIARTSWLKVHSGAEVMALLLSSERVYADMLDWDRFGEPEQICLRAWDPRITMDYEFRLFVCSNEMTAVSQYDHYAHYPHLERQRGVILQAIRDAWRVIHPHLGVDSYCLDVAYVPATGTCVMIELSPFLACTGPALFNWSSATDLQTLEGKAPFEFRLKAESSLHPQLEDLLEINWDDRWSRLAAHSAATSYRYDQLFAISAEDHEAQTLSPAARGGLFLSDFMSGAATALGDFFSSIALSSRGGGHMSRSECETLLFVYGTLKRDFQWNEKYLHQRQEPRAALPYSHFISTAITKNKHVLLIGDCGVPYLSLLPSSPKSDDIAESSGHVVGELWAVSRECLRNLDAYEGTNKGYYKREEISVCVPETSGCSFSEQVANVYHLTTPMAELINIATPVLLDDTKEEGCSSNMSQHMYPRAEYTLEQHRALYNPVQHIQVKQLNYIQHQPSHWGHSSQPSLEVSAEAATAATQRAIDNNEKASGEPSHVT